MKQVFVSVHPFNQPGSLTYDALVKGDMCTSAANKTFYPWGGFQLPTCGPGARAASPGAASPGAAGAAQLAGSVPGAHTNCLYDPSNLAARRYLWETVKASYYDKGITNFWTDGTEHVTARAVA